MFVNTLFRLCGVNSPRRRCFDFPSFLHSFFHFLFYFSVFFNFCVNRFFSRNKASETLSNSKMAMDPVSFLQLHCNLNNFQLEFTPISEQKSPGTAFTYRCDMEHVNTTGSAPSKKRAKQVSARLMISYMLEHELCEFGDIGRAQEVLASDIEKEAREQENKLLQAEGGEAEHNPVSKLGELCSKKHWTTPTYHDDGQEGQPHERVFRIMCTLENLKHSTVGEGTNKKAARRSAAQKMLDYLRQENHDLVDEVLDRLPNDTEKNTEGKAFIDCIKRAKSNQLQFGQCLHSKQIDDVIEELSHNAQVWEYINEFTNGDLIQFGMEGADKLSLQEMTDILNMLCDIAGVEVRISRTRDTNNYLCNIGLEKNNCLFFSWYGKDSERDEATRLAYCFALKSFVEDIQLFR